MRNLENRNTQNGDEQLKMLFGNLKDERLPEGFRQRMMSRIEKEAVRKSRSGFSVHDWDGDCLRLVL